MLLSLVGKHALSATDSTLEVSKQSSQAQYYTNKSYRIHKQGIKLNYRFRLLCNGSLRTKTYFRLLFLSAEERTERRKYFCVRVTVAVVFLLASLPNRKAKKFAVTERKPDYSGHCAKREAVI